MRRILFCILSVLFCMPIIAQNDPVVMTVNGYDVKKSEFEYFFKKNNTETKVTRKTVNQYADLYLNFKLKVQAAVDEGMDKSSSFLNEYKMYRDMQAEEYLVDEAFLENLAHSTYENTLTEIGETGLARLYVIKISPVDDSEEAMGKCYELISEVYGLLEEGQPFRDLASKYSNDAAAPSGGDLGWVSARELPGDVSEIVFSLAPGEYSEPFVSDDSFFIVYVSDRRQLGTYEENQADIYEWLLTSEAYSEAKRRKANDYATRLGWSVRDDEAVAYLDSVLEEVEPDFNNISREYHDGLLLFDISNREIWERVSNHPEEMEEYFQSHLAQFSFEKPCFKGMVLFCQNEDVYNQLKNILEGIDMSEWVDSIIKFNKEDIKVRVMRGSSETGIFKQGQNAYVDKIVFGKGEYEPMEDYPYVNVVGKVLKHPDSIQDVAGQVADEYQKYLEDEWVKKLRSKYSYKINKKALKKVSLK